MNALAAEDVAPHRPEDLAAFGGVEAWVFDLDNTLYPRDSNLFVQIDDRIRAYVQKLLDVDADEAFRIQKGFYEEHGTSLRGLMLEHDVDPDSFLAYVHDIDRSALKPAPQLADAIRRLPGRKFIFTNGSRAHAEKTAEQLGFTDHFEDIFDIVAAQLMPKPRPETYDRFMKRFHVEPEKAAMFEDLSRNLLVPKEIGMRTTLVVPTGTREVFHEEWEMEGHQGAPHVDFVTDDLATFVEDIAAAIGV
ncbi:pyrimidine 5'-nucleotidase [Afifella sp. IM 167]|uniref:pyrimidine 5'-nucleotidase n=1 Tax=Afifella sp. IM 167 TaxID=2033586 RepID=UPI001CCB347C|nr:pyrimidine 5'-nucleotidase [Afifella sp. IM 167]MBZ8133813.1 pyrimidine 5'-nucleotidase [Afifella sp. IM 167]